ncbi:MAG: hypothetical protein JWQ49_5166 [Edaphobacter sp.]|nr:hypothetical protein [Edaphobacter sp.]
MKIEANGLWRGAVFIFELVDIQTTNSQMTKGDGSNLRPND